MSQVLEKPILLDETGQEIAGKLDTNSAAIVDVLEDIKDAIGTSSEFIPIMIRITTPPTKTAYIAGETLDLSGMVVMLVASNGAMSDVTAACTFSPADGSTVTSATTSVEVSFYYVKDDYTFTTSQEISVKELSSIAITTAPTKTSYRAGETLDLTGMVVTATYGDGTTVDVTNRCSFNPANGATLTSANTSVTVTYTEGGTTKTATQVISVSELQSIAVTTPPTTTSYMVGDTLDLTGIEVTATYTDNTTADVTSSCVFSPVDGATLSGNDTAVTISYTEAGITKTASQQINVAAIYGVHWDATSSSAFSRTDAAANFVEPNPYYSGMATTPSSPFDNIAPWKDMQVVEDATAGTLVSIPKFYYKLTQDDSFNYDLKIQISSAPVAGFSVSPAHMDRGDGEGERDVIYVGRYHSNQTDYKSTTGVTPAGYSNGSRATSRTKLHQLGTDIWLWDYATLFTIWLLYLVEFADWNSQAKIGYGCGNTGNYSDNGYTDLMPYHTGTTMTSKTTYGFGTQYRHIEGLWDDVFDWVDGCYAKNNALNIIINPNNFSDNANGISAGSPINGDYIKKMVVHSPSGLFPLFYPVDVYSGGDSDGNTYCCDGGMYVGNDNAAVFRHGGRDSQYLSTKYGLFYLANAANSSAMENGSRLMKLPNS